MTPWEGEAHQGFCKVVDTPSGHHIMFTIKTKESLTDPSYLQLYYKQMPCTYI